MLIVAVSIHSATVFSGRHSVLFNLYLLRYDFDGVFLCFRSQCRPADFGYQLGFNEPVREDYLKFYGKDIRKEDFDLSQWCALLGSYITYFLADVKSMLQKRNMTLSVGLPRGDIIGPPMGNWTLEWRQWIEEGIVDEIVINQNSSQCPSMWHQLWPMHRGYGYLQNYIDGKNLNPLKQDIQENYGPKIQENHSKLYVARQWHAPHQEQEGELLSLSGVSGLVFSTFRYDNPGPVSKGDWLALINRSTCPSRPRGCSP